MKAIFIVLVTMLCCLGAVEAQPIGAQLLPSRQFINAGDVAAILAIDTTQASHQILGSFATSSKTEIFGRKIGIAYDALMLATLSFPNSQFFMNFNGKLDTRNQALAFVITPQLSILRGVNMHFVAVTWNPFRQNKLHVSPVAVVSIR